MLALAVAGMVTAAIGGVVWRRRNTPSRRLYVPSAAGGAAPETSDAGNELVEDGRTYAVSTFSFALENYDVRIEDAGMSTAFDAILERTGADLVVNAGFFDTAARPLGYAVSEGAVLSKHVKNLSGGVVTIDGDVARLWDAETYEPNEGTHFAIQCRPRLVVDRAPNVRRDDGKRSERTALCLRDGGRTVDVVLVRGGPTEATGPSLYALGRFLAQRGCEDALNLDGGPSTGVAYREGDEVKLVPPRGGVRQVLVFKRR
ncbi:hypothetical protein AKJ09_04796 [Labilithrix luteola]|uniref:Phosphodiester glycosidase domain-containing protein n=1 Tax=Labilithrix luteola TaxID=1391654 RepID=A0A0K1PX86_9BACT|nr:hypothetical protein AKJ09_04796 [Labilithrix luteola]